MINKKERDVNEIIPNLWLGNCKAAYNINFLKKYNIKYVLTVMNDFNYNYKFNNVIYQIIPICDKQVCKSKLTPIFEQANEFIKTNLSKDSGVLVHCKRGHHRSASIVASYLLNI